MPELTQSGKSDAERDSDPSTLSGGQYKEIRHDGTHAVRDRGARQGPLNSVLVRAEDEAHGHRQALDALSRSHPPEGFQSHERPLQGPGHTREQDHPC